MLVLIKRKENAMNDTATKLIHRAARIDLLSLDVSAYIRIYDKTRLANIIKRCNLRKRDLLREAWLHDPEMTEAQVIDIMIYEQDRIMLRRNKA